MNSNLGQSTLKSTTECIGIRAQLRNPINTQLPRRGNQVGGEAERKIWVAKGFTLSFLFFSFLFFSFLFFSFLFFSFLFFSFSVFRRFRVDYFFLFSLFSFYFLDLDVIVLSRSWMQNSILFKLLSGLFEVQTNFWNSTFPVSNCSCSYDQRIAVVCNSVIEETSFH